MLARVLDLLRLRLALAINRFAAPFAGATIVVLGTYYAAQWAITLSATRTEPERT